MMQYDNCRLGRQLFFGGNMMNEQMKPLPSQNRNSRKLVVAVYIVLRFTVLITLVFQLLNKKYENVYICLLTLFLFMIPSFAERWLHVSLPDVLEIVILVFIFAAEILGEIQDYYQKIPCWDTILHTVNGFLFTAIGFSITGILNKDKALVMRLSPFYMTVTAFCFSMTIGILWEFFEWGIDSWFGLDMQKDTVITQFASSRLSGLSELEVYHIGDVVLICDDGTQVRLMMSGYLDIGLHDTMMDMLVNSVGAGIFSLLGYFYIKTDGKGQIACKFIPRVNDHMSRNGSAGD